MLAANKTLEQLYCSKSEQSWDIRTSGASLELYNGEDISHMAHGKQRVALLSVVQYQAEHCGHKSPYSRLDSVVIAIIFSFCPRLVRRVVYFSPPDPIVGVLITHLFHEP